MPSVMINSSSKTSFLFWSNSSILWTKPSGSLKSPLLSSEAFEQSSPTKKLGEIEILKKSQNFLLVITICLFWSSKRIPLSKFKISDANLFSDWTSWFFASLSAVISLIIPCAAIGFFSLSRIIVALIWTHFTDLVFVIILAT